MTDPIHIGEISTGLGGNGDEPGTEVTLPVEEILTGRAFLTGKSGSGKSNSASVVIESLLDRQFPVLIVDTDGEYYGLKEQYELLHVGGDDEADLQVEPEHAEKLASLALDQNVPIILDVSGYLDDDVVDELIKETLRHLFAKEKKLKRPFLVVIEEIHEYIPEKGGLSDAGKMIIKIGKRGRKHGLGIAGISQRPADVKKDYITQCDWLVWHRLTWQNDTKVVRRVLDKEHADAIEDMNNGEGFLQTDFGRGDIRRVQFKRKKTFDAGATPGLDDFERPDLKSVDEGLVEELQSISKKKRQREDRVSQLEHELEQRDERIEELESELKDAKDMQEIVERVSTTLASADTVANAGADPEAVLNGEVNSPVIKAEVMEVVQERNRELEDELGEKAQRVRELEEERQDLLQYKEVAEKNEDLASLRDEMSELITRHEEVLGVGMDTQVEKYKTRISELESQIGALEEKIPEEYDDEASLLMNDVVEEYINEVADKSPLNNEHVMDTAMAIAGTSGLTAEATAPHTKLKKSSISKILNLLENENILTVDKSERPYVYRLNADYLQSFIAQQKKRERIRAANEK